MSDYVSVKDFGAKGDGVTDDTIALQTAINQRGLIYFPPGKYVFIPTSAIYTLMISGGTTLFGNMNVEILCKGAYPGVGPFWNVFTFAENSSDFRISGLKIDGGSSKTIPTRYNGIVGQVGSNNVVIDSVVLRNCGARGIITNNQMNWDTDGNQCYNWKISNCSIIDNGDKCFSMKDVINATIVNCYASTNMDVDTDESTNSLFEASGWSRFVSFTNCTGEAKGADWGPGLRVVHYCSDVAFVNCHVSKCMQGMVTQCARVSFIGCSSDTSNSDGVLIQNTDVTVLGCQIKNPTNAGINLSALVPSSSDPRIVVSDCIINSDDGNMLHGIRNAVAGYTLKYNNIRIIGNTNNEISGICVSDIYGDSLTVARDAVEQIKLPLRGDIGIIEFISYNNPAWAFVVSYRAAASGKAAYILSSALPDRINVSTAILTGTTGTAGNITISMNTTNGYMSIENRSSSAITFLWRTSISY